MATIGTATLQIIPSLLGVTEAIEKQIDGKVVNVAISPKVDQKAAETAGKQAKETVEKQTTQVKVEPKLDEKAAKNAGKQAGKTVNDEIASSAKSNAGKEAAKAIVDGIADGVKKEIPRGRVGEAIVDGIADGVKQGIDGVGIGGKVVDTIGTGIKSGNLGRTIKDAIVPAIKGIGDELRSGAASWSGDIAKSLRSGDIQGATTEIGNTVRTTTDLIADIGNVFGLQLDGVRDFGDKAGTTLSEVGGDIQDVVTKATGIYDTLSTVGNVLDTVLPLKAKNGTAAMAKSWLDLIPIIGQVMAAWELGKTNPAINPNMPVPDGSTSVKGPDGKITIYDKNGKPFQGALTGPSSSILGGGGGFGIGGYTGSMPVDKIAGVVHGGEFVINAGATRGIENAMPGLLDYLNNKGTLPGYEGGGKVQLGNISGAGITTAEQQSMWDAVRGRFPNAVLSSATRTVMTEGHPDFHNSGRAIDISGPGMGAIASWIASTYPDSLELIHSPFSANIKNGKNVGDGTAYYGAGLMAAHRNHVHWALGKTASISSAVIPQASASEPVGATTGSMAQESSAQSSSSSSISLASSISGMAGTWGDQLGAGVGKTQSGSDLSLFGKAAGSAATGQVASALGTFGIGDAPGWLKGISQLANSITIGGPTAAGGAASPLGGSVSPTSAIAPAISAATNVVGGIIGGQTAPPVAQTTFNIATTDIEPAYLASQRLEKERAAARLAAI